MQTFHNRRLHVLPEFYILVAASLLILPFQWVLAWFFASTIHELCHYIILRVCSVTVYSVKISVSGVIMETEAIHPCYEVLSAIAGPMGGLILVLFLRFIPHIAICALVQSVFNLLPIYPLDGGRVLRCCVAYWFCDEKTNIICRHTENLMLLILLCLSIILSIYCRLGSLPIIVILLIFLKYRKIKTPCK